MFFGCQMTDQSIKKLEDLQDEYDFKLNTLKNRGGFLVLLLRLVLLVHVRMLCVEDDVTDYVFLCRERRELFVTQGAGQGEDVDRNDVLGPQDHATGQLTHHGC